jgi:undecaprenyl-diphosphatase
MVKNMSLINIVILAVVQGLTELLPVSSSAHVIVAEKLMGLNPVSPEMTLFLVMLHTGTIMAVIAYFWNTWKTAFFSSKQAFFKFLKNACMATVFTAIVGITLMLFIEKILLRHVAHAEVEMIFGNTTFISIALAASGLLILFAGLQERKIPENREVATKESMWIGAIQGLCLPFRGFSRSGATISTGLILKIEKTTNEAFSFALAVILTPPVIIREALRLFKTTAPVNYADAVYPCLIGMVLSFIAGLFALHWLSKWLNRGQWKMFGFYCIAASIILFLLAQTKVLG